MNAIKVSRDHGDWTATCTQHGVSTSCSDWELALEAAYGHAAMAHPIVCTHEYGWHPMNRPEEHKCLDCGIPMPVAESRAADIAADMFGGPH